jgi:prepilin-type processing-associated H-X9-DG protein
VGGLGTSWVAGAWRDHQVLACKNNLRQFHQALLAYSDGHDGAFPRVEAQPPRNVAGIFVPILRDAGCLPPNVSLTCDAARPGPVPPSLDQLQAIQQERPEDFQALVRGLSGCYAYSLGYLSNGTLNGLRRDDSVPILADRPPFGPDSPVADDNNSPNHGGRGQNVLYTDGHVAFRTVRRVNGDDLYLNQNGKVAAGQCRADSVLAVSWACPYPRDE